MRKKNEKMVVTFDYMMNRLNEKIDYCRGLRDVWISILHKDAEEIEDFIEWEDQMDKAKRSYKYATDNLYGMMEAYEMILEDLGGRRGNFTAHINSDTNLIEKITWTDWDE